MHAISLVIALFLFGSCSSDLRNHRKVNAPKLVTNLMFAENGIAPGQTRKMEFETLDGVIRLYNLHIPKSFRVKMPLVVVLHGGGGNADEVMAATGMTEAADRLGFVALFPQGTGSQAPLNANSWNAVDCCSPATDNDVDDVGFITGLLDEVEDLVGHDPARVYVTGISNGAQMAYRLAAELSHKITAVAPVAGTGGIAHFENIDITGQRGVPTLHLHGVADRCALYNGGWSGGCYARFLNKVFGTNIDPEELWREPVEGFVARWRERNNIAAGQHGDPQPDIELNSIENLGHVWPGEWPGMCIEDPKSFVCRAYLSETGPVRLDVSANDLIWDFFKDRFREPRRRYRQIVAGQLHACAIDESGRPWCWGSDVNGQLGQGSNRNNAHTPVRVRTSHMPDPRFRTISAGRQHTCGITRDNKAWCWGWGTYGQLGQGHHDDLSIPMPVKVPQRGMRFKKISAGESHTCAVSLGEHAWCWGNNHEGQVGVNDPAYHLVPQLVQLPAGTKVSDISTGELHSCALDTVGNIYCWGNNRYGQLGNGKVDREVYLPELVDMSAVGSGAGFQTLDAGGYHTCAIDAGGTGWCWGNGASGQLGNGVLGVKPRPVRVALNRRERGFISLSSGRNITCGVTNRRVGYCWGNDRYGNLGNGEIDGFQSVPSKVDTSPLGAHRKFGMMAATKSTQDLFACGLSGDGYAWCWGRDSDGQLGNGQSGESIHVSPSPVH